jgi:hypothetical protein
MTKRNLEQHTQGPGALLHQAPERAHQTPGRRWRGGWRLSLAMALAPLAWMAPAQAQQILYPTPSEPNAIMVTGVGFAKSKPDSAELFFELRTETPESGMMPMPVDQPNPAPPPKPKPMTAALLAPVVEAIAAAGVDRSAIKTNFGRESPSRFFRSGEEMGTIAVGNLPNEVIYRGWGRGCTIPKVVLTWA